MRLVVDQAVKADGTAPNRWQQALLRSCLVRRNSDNISASFAMTMDDV